MNYWLMKSEPDCYSIEDLEREGVNMWEGCRNYVVRNYFRDSMEIGDLAFFHHSNADPSGIAGTMEIVSEAYPDPTQFDPESDYFDPKSDPENPRWLLRDVRFRSRYPKVISLAELRAVPGLEEMSVLKKGQRLSVMPVTEAEWKIVEEMASRTGH
jgi:predicted RNA-binding protein with PUA-like domain